MYIFDYIFNNYIVAPDVPRYPVRIIIYITHSSTIISPSPRWLNALPNKINETNSTPISTIILDNLLYIFLEKFIIFFTP